MNFRLEVVLHGEGEQPAARLEGGCTGRGEVGIDVGNSRHLGIASGRRSRSAAAGFKVRTLIAGSSRARIRDRYGVVIGEVNRVIAATRQTELAQRVIQEIDSRNAELQLLPLRDLEILEQCQIAVKVSWASHVRPLQRTLLSIVRRTEAVRVEILPGLQSLR